MVIIDVSEWLLFAGSRHAAGTTFCQPLCRGQKPQKQAAARQGIARPRGAQPGVLQLTPAKCRTSAVPLFTQKGKVVTLKGG